MSSTPITTSTLATSYFGSMPDFPSIRGAIGATSITPLSTSGNAGNAPLQKPFVRRPGPPVLNKIYFNKKTLVRKENQWDPNSMLDFTLLTWEIPFSVDVEVPIGDLIQRIQNVMKTRGQYKNWDINMNTFLITAVQLEEFKL